MLFQENIIRTRQHACLTLGGKKIYVSYCTVGNEGVIKQVKSHTGFMAWRSLNLENIGPALNNKPQADTTKQSYFHVRVKGEILSF